MKSIFQKKLLIISVAFFLLSCTAFLFVYRTVQEKNDLSQEEEMKRREEEAKTNNVKILTGLMKRIEPERAELESHFVKNEEASDFLETLEGWAQQAGISLQITSVNTGKDLSYLSVMLSARGTFRGTYKFITLLESSPYLLSFGTVDMSKIPGEASVSPEASSAKASSKSAVKSTVKHDPVWSSAIEVKLLSFINE